MKLATGRIYYGWWVAAAASGIEFANAATAIGILSIFVIPMSQEFGWSRTEVAGATSLGSVLGAGLAPFIGGLVDRFGSRVILVTGGTVIALGCLYLSMAQALLGFYVAFTTVRIADQGMVKIAASVSAGKWFYRYRGRAVGLVHFGGSLGGDSDGPDDPMGDFRLGLEDSLGNAGGSHVLRRGDSMRLAGAAATRGPGPSY